MKLEQLVELTIGDVMMWKLLTVQGNETVLLALKKMAGLHVGAVPVVDEEQHVIGIFTERDLMTKVVVPEKDPKTTLVSEAMTKDPETLSSGMPILTAFELLHNRGFRHVPVVNDSKLVGILSVRDLNKLLYQFMQGAVLDQE